MTIALTTTVLDGLSVIAPGIDGDDLFGVVAAWADASSGGRVNLAFSGSSPPYAPTPLGADWLTFDTPAVAIATEWERVYVAFVDSGGYIRLASSTDGWSASPAISKSGGSEAGPALAYSGGVLYAAWRTSDGWLAFATFDENGQTSYVETDVALTSRPTICAADPERIYVCCGGGLDGPAQPVAVYVSQDRGASFSEVAVAPIQAFGPPSLVFLDKFYLAWADGSDSGLRLAVAENLETLDPASYDAGCHGGGPALVPMVDIVDETNPSTWIYSLSSGWSVGSADSNLHHVAIGSLGPLPFPAAAAETRRRRIAARVTRVAAPDPCPDPLTVYDPATDKCVPRLGCWGGCVTSSYTGTPFGPVFNPVAYAICVVKCKNAS
jgi:hypothetical protein